jgi:ParB family chromosome partitioning protein
VIERELSVRDTERFVHKMLNPSDHAPHRKARPSLDADTLRLENELAERLGATVRIEPGTTGAGRIVIGYSSLEQLDGILQHLR